MKKHELLKQLEEFPDNAEICILDWKQNLWNCTGDIEGHSNGIGIHPKFKIEEYKEDVSIPFIGLSFDNDDYTEDGKPIYLESNL